MKEDQDLKLLWLQLSDIRAHEPDMEVIEGTIIPMADEAAGRITERWAGEAAQIIDRAMESGKTELYEVIRRATGFMVLTRLVRQPPVRAHRTKQPHHAVPAPPQSIASSKSGEPVSGRNSKGTSRKAWGTTHRDEHPPCGERPPEGVRGTAPGPGDGPVDA